MRIKMRRTYSARRVRLKGESRNAGTEIAKAKSSAAARTYVFLLRAARALAVVAARLADSATPLSHKRPMKLAASLLACALTTTLLADDAPARIDARMMQMPAVSRTQIAFVYAGDIWIAPKTGGAAVRLSTPRGAESFPRFSPDGTRIAFSGNYDGNADVYVMPAAGGEPRRITHHGANDRLLGWYPDGQSLLFASHMASFTDRASQLFKVSAGGGLPE